MGGQGARESRVWGGGVKGWWRRGGGLGVVSMCLGRHFLRRSRGGRAGEVYGTGHMMYRDLGHGLLSVFGQHWQ